MIRSLSVLLLVGFMIAVGLFYDRQAVGPQETGQDTQQETIIDNEQTDIESDVDLSALCPETYPHDGNSMWLIPGNV